MFRRLAKHPLGMSGAEMVTANQKPPGLAGKQVILRALQSVDAEEFIALNLDSVRFHRGLVSPPTDGEAFAEYLQRSLRPDTACFLICRRDNNTIVGAITLSQIFRGGFQSAYLGYFIGAKFAWRGYGTEAVQLILRYAFKKLKLHRVEANIQPGNVASIALVKRAGFLQEGYSRFYLKIAGKWRDHERWALLAEDWRPLARKMETKNDKR